MQKEPPPFTVCHGDLHAGNLTISDDGRLFLIDWDEALLAPKEKDLMSIGGALLASGITPLEEQNLFYPSYGPLAINRQFLFWLESNFLPGNTIEAATQDPLETLLDV